MGFTSLDFTISETEVHNAIKQLKDGKAVGLDEISGEMIKASVQELMPVIQMLFNKIYRFSIYPSNWAKGYITCLHKKGSLLEPSNYRGITITIALGKVFNTILNERLSKFLRDRSKSYLKITNWLWKRIKHIWSHIYVENYNWQIHTQCW